MNWPFRVIVPPLIITEARGLVWKFGPAGNSPVGLSEYVVPGCSDTNYWGAGLVIPIYVDSTYPAANYGR